MARRKLDLTTTTGIKRALNKVANEVMAGNLGVREANSIAYICNITLNALKAGEYETQDDQLAKAKELLETIDTVIN